jgi:hypothetical protein
MSRLDTFLPNWHNRALFPGFVEFVMAALGAMLGFIADWLSWKWLGMFAFILVVLGVAGGFVFILWRIMSFPRDVAKDLRENRDPLRMSATKQMEGREMSSNWSLDTDPQPQAAASRRVLRAGQLRR